MVEHDRGTSVTFISHVDNKPWSDPAIWLVWFYVWWKLLGYPLQWGAGPWRWGYVFVGMVNWDFVTMSLTFKQDSLTKISKAIITLWNWLSFQQVFYIDVGYGGKVGVDRVRKICQEFVHLPVQAFECCLEGTDTRQGPLSTDELVLTRYYNSTVDSSTRLTMWNLNLCTGKDFRVKLLTSFWLLK